MKLNQMALSGSKGIRAIQGSFVDEDRAEVTDRSINLNTDPPTTSVPTLMLPER